ncbi:MAG: acyltransferase, partial [Puia sp.]|nr:acyltransferase [Puia sp.]
TGGKWLNPVYWSLAIEFQYYLLIAVVFGVIVSPNRYLRLSFFVLFSVSSLLLAPYDRAIFTYAPFFILGILLFQWVCGITSKTEFLILTLMTVGLVFFRHGWELTFIVVAALLVIVYVDKVPAFLRWMGLISYSLYLIHVPIGGRIINIAEVKVHSVFLRECIVFVSFAVCLIAAAMFYKFIERPCKRISGAIRYEPPTPVTHG